MPFAPLVAVPLAWLVPPPPQVAAMVESLSAPTYAGREAATGRLACWITAHPDGEVLVRREMGRHPDPEVRMRCRRALIEVPWCSQCDGTGEAWRRPCEGCGGRRVREPIGR